MAATPQGDPTGAATLERLADAPRFNRWMFEALSPWMGEAKRVLEIGSGIGNMSQFLVDRAPPPGPQVVLTDTAPEYLERLRTRFGAMPNVEVMRLELPTPQGPVADRRFDTIVCLNVLEHIADDVGSLVAMHRLLDRGGRLVLLVPALRALYGTLDRALGHVRRYSKGELRAKFARAAFTMRRLEYFNLAGIPGWWVSGKLLRREMIPAGPLRLYDALVPLFRLERLLPWRIGQSLIAIGEAS